MSNTRFRNFLSLFLLMVGISTLGFAAYALYTDIRYPLGALKAADVQGLRVGHATGPKGSYLRVTGTIADGSMAVRRVYSGHLGQAMWLKVYPVGEQEGMATKIDLRVPLNPGAKELRFGPNKELIWRGDR